jgi:hypothetical protein
MPMVPLNPNFSLDLSLASSLVLPMLLSSDHNPFHYEVSLHYRNATVMSRICMFLQY